MERLYRCTLFRFLCEKVKLFPFFAKAYEDLLHVQNKYLAIRFCEGKTGKPLSSLPVLWLWPLFVKTEAPNPRVLMHKICFS